MSEEVPATEVSLSPVADAKARAKRKKTLWRYAGAGVLAGVIGLIASTGRGAFVYDKTVDEVMVEPSKYVGTEIRVEGTVVPGSLEHTEGSSEYRFTIARKGYNLSVHFSGAVPDTFQTDVDVTVKGKLTSTNMFEANEVVTKCASHYEAQKASGGMPNGQKPSGHPRVPNAVPR